MRQVNNRRKDAKHINKQSRWTQIHQIVFITHLR